MGLALTAFHVTALFAAGLLLVFAAVNDIRRYQIPNMFPAALLVLFPVFVATSPRSMEWQQHLMVFGLVLISGFAMFVGHLAGAGDIKLMAATGLWAGPHLVAMFLVMTALAGGLLALTVALVTHVRNLRGQHAVVVAKVPIPYGVAIAAGGVSIIFKMSQPILFPS